MNSYFRNQITEYAESHQDSRNLLMHIIGNPILALAALLPLSLVPVSALGVQTNLATVLVTPALLMWIAFDVGLGLAVVVTTVPILWAGALIADHVSITWVWIITAVLIVVGWALQIIGHQCFEGRRPSLLDNPMHMLMSPMFVFAKLYVALGFRTDLAALIEKPAHGALLQPGKR